MPILFERMEKEIRHLKSQYDNASVVGSPPDVGELREMFVENLLKYILPSSVEICSGVIAISLCVSVRINREANLPISVIARQPFGRSSGFSARKTGYMPTPGPSLMISGRAASPTTRSGAARKTTKRGKGSNLSFRLSSIRRCAFPWPRPHSHGQSHGSWRSAPRSCAARARASRPPRARPTPPSGRGR